MLILYVCKIKVIISEIIENFKGSVTVRGVGMFMRFFKKSYKV